MNSKPYAESVAARELLASEAAAARLKSWQKFIPSALRFSERKLVLAVGDLLVLNGVLLWALQNRAGNGYDMRLVSQHPLWFVVLSVLWLVSAYSLGAYHLVHATNVRQSLWRGACAAAIACGVYLLVPYVTPVLPDSRLQLLALPMAGVVSIGLWRAFYALVFVHPGFQLKALVVGAGGAGCTLVSLLDEMCRDKRQHHRNIGYRVLGFIDDHESKQGEYINGVPVLGTRHDLVRIARDLKVDEVVVAITMADTIHSELFEAILECREQGISVTPMSRLYEQLSGRVPVEHAGRNLSVTLPLSPSPTHRFYMAAQRVADIIGGALGCLLLLCVIPFVWLINRIGSPGPLFYSQERVGRGGREFTIYKFRSMVVDAEKFSGAVWAGEDDPRITKVGRFLRKTRLDEIPQFLNVLKGEMSLIGPRPERPHFVAKLAKEIPFYRVRHAVRPGLTGWAQVRYRYGASVEDSLVKLQYDLYYIKHQGVLLDLEILFKTVAVVLGFKGR
jgi:exopolysaccharide biosynthesis polyprenyl glycosylphosphotransferase